MAVTGPRELSPYQRGQVAHLVSSPVGAGAFARHEPAPPVEWLCVFDPHVRHSWPQLLTWRHSEPSRFDPFDSYALDGETLATFRGDHLGLDPQHDTRWSAFEVTADERPSARTPTFPSLCGPASTAPPQLPPRLRRLAQWFGRVATDPAAVWWASGQNALHPEMAVQASEALRKD